MSTGQAGSAETAPVDPAGCQCGPGCTNARSPAPVQRDATWQAAARKAKLLAWFSLGYMAAEGTVAILAAVVAGSVALLGFGLDSVIEGLASLIIVWRFTSSRITVGGIHLTGVTTRSWRGRPR